MNDMIISITTVVLDPLAAVCIIWSLLSDRGLRNVSKWLRFGLALCAAGLLAQSYRSGVAFFTGEFPHETYIPFWVFKDWGLIVIASYFAFAHYIQEVKGYEKNQ